MKVKLCTSLEVVKHRQQKIVINYIGIFQYQEPPLRSLYKEIHLKTLQIKMQSKNIYPDNPQGGKKQE